MHGIGIHLQYPAWSTVDLPRPRISHYFFPGLHATCDFCVELPTELSRDFFCIDSPLSYFSFFFINCNFISNPITDNARIRTAYNCSILWLWDEKPIFSLWSHLISKYNAYFYDFAEGGEKSRCSLCDKDYNIRLGTPMFHSYVEKLYSFPKHKQWLGHFHHTTRYLDGEITICYVWGGRLALRVWLDKTNFIHFLFVNDIRCLG